MARNPKKSLVGVRINPDHKAALAAAADEAGKTVSNYSADVLTRHLVRTGRIPSAARPPVREQETAA